MPVPVAYDVVVPAGGRATRLGGLDKAALVVDGRSLLEHTLAAVTSARAVVVVGSVDPPPAAPGRPLGVVVEDPPGGGPVAAIAAGLTWLGPADEAAPWVLVLAVDQPGVGQVVPRLLAAAATAPEGGLVDLWCPVDGEGRAQWLLAAYRRTALEDRLRGLADPAGRSMRSLVADLATRTVPGVGDHLGDIDTPADLIRWGARPAGGYGPA